MGFFVPDEELRPPAKAKPGAARSGARIGCDACGLKQVWPSILSPRMKVSGAPDADILILGGNLTEPDDIAGKPWQGDGSAPMLRKLIPGWMADRIAYQSMVRCYPNRGSWEDLNHAHACSIHLIEDIERLPIKYILAVGNLPVRYFVPGQSLSDIYGTKMPVQIGSKTLWFYPVFDPHYVYQMLGKFDDGPVAPVFNSDIKRFFKECDSWPAPKIYKPDPLAVLMPQNYEEGANLIDRMVGKLGYDIEAGREGHGDHSGVLKPIHNLSGLLTVEANPTPRLTIYANYGGDYAGRDDYAYSGSTTLGAPTATFCPTTAGAFACTAVAIAAALPAFCSCRNEMTRIPSACARRPRSVIGMPGTL